MFGMTQLDNVLIEATLSTWLKLVYRVFSDQRVWRTNTVF